MLAFATHPATKSNCRAGFHSALANFCRCRHNHKGMFNPAKLGQNRESQLWFNQVSKTLSVRVQKRHGTGKTNVVLPPALRFGCCRRQRQIINFRVFRMPAALGLCLFGKHFRNWRRLPRQGLWLWFQVAFPAGWQIAPAMFNPANSNQNFAPLRYHCCNLRFGHVNTSCPDWSGVIVAF